MTLVVAADGVGQALAVLEGAGQSSRIIGTVEDRPGVRYA
jgi:phosphoribosylaminoimidazole (AIR) synthetase